MPAAPDIEELLTAVAAGDRAAFQALYAATSSKLFGISLRICRDRAVAEDALQTAYMEIWRNAKEFDGARGRAGAWMAVIARNCAIDQIRRRGRGPALGSGAKDGEDEDAMRAIPDLSKPEDGGAEMIALAQCLDGLEPKVKEMVLLAYHGGLSREELSVRYDAPVNTIKTWLRRGLASLRSCLEE